jgi:predicted membrane-bound spermidine synthase
LFVIGAVALYSYFSRNVHIVVVVAFFFSGASGLILESLWTRMLRHVFGSTTLAIATVLTAFMGGLALGSYLFGRYADRIKKPLLVYAVAEGIVGVYALIVPYLVQDIYPYVNDWMWANFETNYSWLSVLRFGFSALALILPSTMMGSTLPLLARHFISRPEGMKQIGLNVGILYTLNTMGAIAGTFIAGFILLPEIGQLATNYSAASINIILCATILLLRKPLLAEREDKSTYTERAGFLSILIGIFILAFCVATIVACWGFNQLWFVLFVLLLILVGGMLIFRGVLQGMESKRGGSGMELPPVQMYPISRAARMAALVTFFFSGVAAMNYQVIWSRALAMVIGSSVYSFTIILLAFLVGIAIGSAIYSSWMSRIRNPVLHLGFMKGYVGMMAVLNFLITDDLPFWFARLVVRNVDHYQDHIGTVQFFMFTIAALAIIPVTIGMGAGFPLTIKIATSGHEHVGRDVGNIYAINTVGCIIGSFASAFILVPGFSMFVYEHVTEFSHGYGLQYAVYASLIMNFSMSFILLMLAPKRPELLPIKYVIAPLVPAWAAVLIAFAPPWNLAHMTLGTFRLSLGEDATDPSRIAEPDLVFYFDGMSTTVSVERWGRHLALKNNGKVDASNGEDMSTQIMVAGYPLVFHPAGPEGLRMANIGFGSGTTLGTASQFPIEHIDVVELEPSVSGPPGGYHTRTEWEAMSADDQRIWRDQVDYRRERAGARFFTEINHDPWATPWVNIINNDGRNYTASTSRRYDIIVSEPSNPWITGVSDLFTIDHFRAASQALAPHGIFCQWVQLYELSPENIQAVFRAMAAVFPYMIVFAAEDLSSDTVILASYDPIPLDYERVQRAMSTPAAQRELERAYVYSPFDVFARVILASREEVLAYSSQPSIAGRGCPDGTEDQSQLHLDRIGGHHRGVCIGPEGGDGLGQCDADSDCEGTGMRCLAGPYMGVCEGGTRVCLDDNACRSEDDPNADARCRVCAVELNTDDNSRIEFNAPRDLIGYERFEHYVGTFYSPDWPYGRVCNEPGNDENCNLRGMGEGDEAATNYANLALSLIGHGKIDQAHRFIQYADEVGTSPRTLLAARVYQYLLTNDDEPVPQFGPPVPAPQMDEGTRSTLADQWRTVMEAVEQQHWPLALSSLEQIPATVRRASGPDMAFMAAYLLYKNTTQGAPRYREASQVLQDMVRLEEDYVRAHPEVYYFLARCYRMDYSYDRARRFMVSYVESLTGEGEQPASEGDEPTGGISDDGGEGSAPKDTHPDYGGRTVPISEDDTADAAEAETGETEGDAGDEAAASGEAAGEPEPDAEE